MNWSLTNRGLTAKAGATLQAPIRLMAGKGEKMAVSWGRFSCWLLGVQEKEPVLNESSLNSYNDWGMGLREPDTAKFPTKSLVSPRKAKKKWQSREQRRVAKQCFGDVVLVPSDGEVSLSGSESDGPDWSIGWVEPHGPDFRSDEEDDDGFAVLVPCYRPGCKELVESSNNKLLSAIKNLPYELSSEGKNCMEWLSSL